MQVYSWMAKVLQLWHEQTDTPLVYLIEGRSFYAFYIQDNKA